MVISPPPLVSVVIPTYNRAAMVERAVMSVLRQTHKSLECIVVDDASTDDTPDVLNRLMKCDERLVCIRHKTNRFASASRNTGISVAKGEFIALLDDDDEWLPSKIEKQVELIRFLPDKVGLVYCWMDYFDSQDKIVREHHPTYKGNVFPFVLDNNRIGGCPTLLVRKSVFQKVRGFDPTLRIEEDNDFIIRVAKYFEVDYVPEVLVKVHTDYGRNQISKHEVFDAKAIRNSIISQKAKLRHFEDKLEQYRRQGATIYALLGNLHGRLGGWRKAYYCFSKAFFLFPLNWTTYRQFLSLLKFRMRLLTNVKIKI